MTSSAPPLTPGEIRRLLSECVTAVKPGETLVVRVSLAWTPDDIYRYQRNINTALDEGLIPFKVLIIAAEELGVAESGQGQSGETDAAV